MKNIPSINITLGSEAIKATYLEIINSSQVSFICSSSQYEEVLGDWWEKTYAGMLEASKANIKEIVPDTQENRSYATHKPYKTRFMPEPNKAEADIITTKEATYIISFNPNLPSVITIKDPEITRSFQNQFNQLWTNLK